MKRVLAIFLLGALVGCASNDTSGSRTRVGSQDFFVANNAFLDENVGVLIDQCIAFVEDGTRPNTAAFHDKGYEVGTLLGALRYTRSLGTRTIDRLNGRGVSMLFSEKFERCNVSLTSVGGGVQLLGDWVAGRIAQQGYRQTPSDRPRRFVFTKGNRSLLLSGSSANGQSVVWLQKVS
ncbi:hypothetical protein [Epibacterium ulvae]|uniref:hypothetical protein n=1 Tax=Epibacterium ulvae TaxID=1156985 RepID=UPI0024933B32|nr:hypothetical protein [Epibacterium ulvae]